MLVRINSRLDYLIAKVEAEEAPEHVCLVYYVYQDPMFTKTLKPVSALLRQLGVRLIIYIDDILILADSKKAARDHAIGLVYLLENLGSTVSRAKCQLEPTQTIEFLGFLVNSLPQELSHHQGTIKKIRAEVRALLKSRQVAIRKLSQLLGKLQAATRAVPLAPLFFCKLQHGLKWGLEQSGHDYSMQVTLSTEEHEELQWWLDHLTVWNGKSFLMKKPSMVIESDASTRGWGATCEGVCTGGPWSPEERQWHINCLEALAAFYVLNCFVRDKNKLEGTVSPRLNTIVRDLWLWCMNRDITLTLEVDLFASRLITQLDRFCSWRPDPEALDAFSKDWTTLQGRGYANPPWSLVGRVLNRVQQQKVTLVLIAPVWKSQPWYPTLLELLPDYHSAIS